MSLRTGLWRAARTASGSLFAVAFVVAALSATDANAQAASPTYWPVTDTPLTDPTTGSSIGVTQTITSSFYGISITWNDITASNECSDYVSISFRPGGSQTAQATGNTSLTGTCIIAGNQALEESTGTLPTCDPTNPSSWSSGCQMPPICPTAGTATAYSCGSSQLCACISSAAGSGAASVCPNYYTCGSQTCDCYTAVSNGTISSQCLVASTSNYYCGAERLCACTPQGSPGATASYCASGQANTAASPCIPQPGNYVNAPAALTSPYIAQIEAALLDMATNNATQASPALIAAITGLADQTDSCAQDINEPQ